MPNEQQKEPKVRPNRIALTARLSLNAYDAITEIQRRYRRKSGRHLPLWKVLDAAIIAYAKRQGVIIEE